VTVGDSSSVSCIPDDTGCEDVVGIEVNENISGDSHILCVDNEFDECDDDDNV
jgi:hypothetical protein